ncbi:MAG: class I SAM-dependent methyltransferase [Cellvibrionaceae bacterium]
MDYFKHKADVYEKDKNRVKNVNNIASAILKAVTLKKSMHIMDFGSGTGLLLEKIAPFVEKITAIDISSSMNSQLREKQDQLPCELDIQEVDLTNTSIDQRFDGIISSMTMHHIEDTQTMFVKLYGMLNDSGFIAIADLDTESGDFHSEDTGVFHFGFDREVITSAAVNAGFKNVEIRTVSTIEKPQGMYTVFLLTATT